MPVKKSGSFVPLDIIKGESIASPSSAPKQQATQRKPKPIFNTVLPKDLKVIHGNDRLKDIRHELTRLKRDDYPNAGAVLLRVFFELSVVDYLKRTGDLGNLVQRLKNKNKLPHHGMPKFRDILDEIKKIAKKELNSPESQMVEKAIRHDPSAPFSINELHAFVHSSDFPISKDIFQFWKRTEPLFRLMLEKDLDLTKK